MGIKVIHDVTEEFITLDEARNHLRVDAYGSPAEHPDDALITGLIQAARERAEEYTGRSIGMKTLELTLDAFPKSLGSCSTRIQLMRGPVNAIDFIRYMDVDSIEKTMDSDDYALDANSESLWWLNSVSDTGWPATKTIFNAGRIRYVAGYEARRGSPGWPVLPQSIKQGMLLCIAFWYENRGDAINMNLLDVPMAALMLWRNYRTELSMA